MSASVNQDIVLSQERPWPETPESLSWSLAEGTAEGLGPGLLLCCLGLGSRTILVSW